MTKIIDSLHQNASDFFDKVSQKNQTDMECKKGCSLCCKVDLNVFEIEAQKILDWFKNLEHVEQKRLVNLWQTPHQEGYCSFLYQDSCTAYEARPTICRTQGLPLYLEKENILDYCPLNFQKKAPPKEDWLNLERLNTMLSLAARTNHLDERMALKSIKIFIIEEFSHN